MFRAIAVLTLLALPAAAAPPTTKPVVAVLYFDVPEKNDDLLALRKGIAELLITDLVATDQLTVVERTRLEDVLGELQLQASGKVDPQTAQKIGKLLGARYLVWGSVFVFGKNPPVFMTKVVTVETGVQRQTKQLGNLDDIMDVEQRMAADAVATISEFERTKPAEIPKKATRLPFGTAVKYSKALDAKDKKDKTQAVKLLNEVVKEQPDFKLAQLDLLNLTN